MTETPFFDAVENIAARRAAARTMLKVLKRITEPGQGIYDIREMAEFAIAQAEKAGITTGEDDGR